MIGMEDLRVAVNGSPVATTQVLMSGREVPGLLHTAMVTGPGALVLDIGVFLADGVTPDPDGLALVGQVWCRQKIGGPDIFGRLERRQRIGLYQLPNGDLLMELRTLVPSDDGEWANARNLSIGEMDSLAREPVADLLGRHGFSTIGTRGVVFGDTGRRRNSTAGTISTASSVEGAIWGYNLTRVFPLLRSLEAGV